MDNWSLIWHLIVLIVFVVWLIWSRSLVRKSAEKERCRREADEKVRDLARMMDEYPNPVLRLDADGRVEYANPAAHPILNMLACRVGGVAPEEWRSMTAGALKDGTDGEMEISWNSRIYSVACAPQPERGRVNYYARDITLMKSSEAELSEFKRLLDQARFGVCTLTLNSVFIYVNRSFAEMHGYEIDEIVGQRIDTLHTREQMPVVERLIDQVINSGGFNGEEVWNKKRDGMAFPMLMNATLTRDSEGKPLYIAMTCIDITDRKEMENQLRHNQKMEAVGRLAGGVAHDFNNLLTGIIGFAQLAISQEPEHSDTLDDLKEIYRLADRASELTRKLLAFGRKQPLLFRLIDLNELVADMVKMLKRLIGEHIELVFMPGEPLAGVNADPGQIEQALVNLAVNARDAMPEGGVLTIATAEVRLDENYAAAHKGVRTGNYVMLSVSDTGCGIDDKAMDHLFEPYFTTKPMGKGAGLGLPTVYGIVKQHGGNVCVNSEAGRGTAFKLYLPRAEGEVRKKTESEERVIKGGNETILVVEDETPVRIIACRALENYGYRPLAAATPMKAEEIFEHNMDEIDLLLSDIIMPGGDGHQLYTRLAARKPGLKVVFMSGYDDSRVFTRNIFDLKHRFIKKPFEINEMLEAVRDTLDS